MLPTMNIDKTGKPDSKRWTAINLMRDMMGQSPGAICKAIYGTGRSLANDGGPPMAAMTYYVALAFKRSEDDGGNIVACDPKEARSSEQAMMAGSLATQEGHCGAIAFSRTGDPALGDFDDAVILKTFGEVDIALLST
jgi:hypothetical protein